jgi:hypothetical protein
MDKVKFFQDKLNTFFAKNSAIQKRSLKLILSFGESECLKCELWSSNNEFIEYIKFKDILNLSFVEKMVSGTTDELIEENLIKWFKKTAEQNNMALQEVGGLLKSNGEYVILKNRSHFKELKINEII